MKDYLLARALQVAAVVLWIGTLILFVLEPPCLQRWFRQHAQRDPAGTLAIIARPHWLLLAASLVTLAGAAAGATAASADESSSSQICARGVRS